MNQYLVALIGLLVVFAVGALSYGVLFKASLKDNAVALSLPRFVVAGIGMYVIALALTVLYNGFAFASGITGSMKGLYLGLLVGVPFFAIPLFADAPYFKVNDKVMWAVIINWVLALAVLGFVIGWLLG